jgi:hypothetical protein
MTSADIIPFRQRKKPPEPPEKMTAIYIPDRILDTIARAWGIAKAAEEAEARERAKISDKPPMLFEVPLFSPKPRRRKPKPTATDD